MILDNASFALLTYLQDCNFAQPKLSSNSNRNLHIMPSSHAAKRSAWNYLLASSMPDGV